MRILRTSVIVLGLAALGAGCGGSKKPVAAPAAADKKADPNAAPGGAPPADPDAAADETRGGGPPTTGADPCEGGE